MGRRAVQGITGFLFAMPGWLSGAARSLDVGATFDVYNVMRTPEQADTWATMQDWMTVGNDFRYVILRERRATKSPPSQKATGPLAVAG